MKKIIILVSLYLFINVHAYAAPDVVDMKLKSIDGSSDKLSNYRGKWVVVNFWATWCPPCVEEMPELQAFHDEHKNTNGVVLGVNNESVSDKKLKQFLDDYFITYPIYTSKPRYNTEVGPIPGLPTTYLVSPQGTVEARQVGGVTKEMLERFIANWKPKS